MDKEKAPEGGGRGKNRVNSQKKKCRIVVVTFSGFALSDEIGSSGVAGGQQLPLCVFAAKFAKVPAWDLRTKKMNVSKCQRI